jgi:hypothetical protein
MSVSVSNGFQQEPPSQGSEPLDTLPHTPALNRPTMASNTTSTTAAAPPANPTPAPTAQSKPVVATPTNGASNSNPVQKSNTSPTPQPTTTPSVPATTSTSSSTSTNTTSTTQPVGRREDNILEESPQGRFHKVFFLQGKIVRILFC